MKNFQNYLATNLFGGKAQAKWDRSLVAEAVKETNWLWKMIIKSQRSSCILEKGMIHSGLTNYRL